MYEATIMYRLKRGVLSIETPSGTCVQIPEGVVLRPTATKPPDPRMVSVLWNDRTFAVFAVDLQERGQHIASAGSAA